MRSKRFAPGKPSSASRCHGPCDDGVWVNGDAAGEANPDQRGLVWSEDEERTDAKELSVEAMTPCMIKEA